MKILVPEKFTNIFYSKDGKKVKKIEEITRASIKIDS